MISFEQMRDGRWRWVFRDPDKKLELVSNEDYDDLAAARASAQAAYPSVSLREPGQSKGEGGANGDGIARKIAQWLTPVVILLAWRRSKRRG